MSVTTRQLYYLAKNALIDASADYAAARAARGEDHPAARAALGRLLYYRGWVPQRGLATPEAVAWHRESGSDPGHMNRAMRRFTLAKRAESPQDGAADEAAGE